MVYRKADKRPHRLAEVYAIDMCLILISYKAHKQYPLILIANRDELYDRKAVQARFWPELPELLAGRDREKGGTWLGLTKRGRIAAVTNYRSGDQNRIEAKSRGELPLAYLRGVQTPSQFCSRLKRERSRYRGYNLIFGTLCDLWTYSNVNDRSVRLEPGIHGVSNHFLNTPWPKVVLGKKILESCTKRDNFTHDQLLDHLRNEVVADDTDLPNTGVGIEMERLLSPIFIRSETYGTRCSTVATLDCRGNVEFSERTYRQGKPIDQIVFQFPLQSIVP